jgi:hypothetical protein
MSTLAEEAAEWVKRLKSRDDCHAYGDSPQHTGMRLEPAECDAVADLIARQAAALAEVSEVLEAAERALTFAAGLLHEDGVIQLHEEAATALAGIASYRSGK